VDGILLDLGVSSMQLDTPERGFAFRHDGDLDMRFDPHSNIPPASEIVNYWEANELADIFFRYGEEKNSRHLAKAIVRNRPFQTTQQLAQVIADATPKKKRQQSTIHPATRIFQALRIVVNNELQVIQQTLPLAIDLLQPGGRLAVISFHSLEDRIVKQVFKGASTEIIAPPGMASMPEKEAIVKLLTRKPIIPTATEIENNPRSRSAKLRVIEKL
jgi:16S rRNA (cytosine1402-N4)-methyltransferase